MVFNSATFASHQLVGGIWAFVNRLVRIFISTDYSSFKPIAISSSEVFAFFLFQEAYPVSIIIAVSLYYA